MLVLQIVVLCISLTIDMHFICRKASMCAIFRFSILFDPSFDRKPMRQKLSSIVGYTRTADGSFRRCYYAICICSPSFTTTNRQTITLIISKSCRESSKDAGHSVIDRIHHSVIPLDKRKKDNETTHQRSHEHAHYNFKLD